MLAIVNQNISCNTIILLPLLVQVWGQKHVVQDEEEKLIFPQSHVKSQRQ